MGLKMKKDEGIEASVEIIKSFEKINTGKIFEKIE
jgi:hypothetical protein